MSSHDHAPAHPHHEPANLPVPFPKVQPKQPRFPKLRGWWNTAWQEHGVLYEMWEDILNAPEEGLRHMAPWLRTVLTAAGMSFTVLLTKAASEVVLDALHQLLAAVPNVQVGVDTSNGVFDVVDEPVRTYIAQHSANLPIAASTVYTLWLLTGITGLVLGYFSKNNGVRATWTAHGAATAWMVWAATPDTSRPVALALTVLTWTLLSAFAMRGLTLHRRVAVGRPAKVSVTPEIHIQVPVSAPPAPADQHNDCLCQN